MQTTALHVPGTPGLLRSINDRAALELLLETGPMTRAQIGDRTGVSRPTASQIVARLEQAGLIETTGAVQGARGPHAVMYAARADVMLGLALDVVPTGVHASLVDAFGTVLADVTLPASEERSAVVDVHTALSAVTDASGMPAARVGTAVVGVQAAADPRSGDLALVGDLPGWPRQSVRSILEASLGFGFRIENDVNLAAIAERDAGRDEPTFSLLWMGDGVGLGSLIDGAVHHGSTGAAGEIGYLAVPASDIDNSQNVQDLVGGLRVAEVARTVGVPGDTLAAHLAAVTTDPDAPSSVAFVEDLARRAAVAIQPVVAVLQPHVVVLGGPTGRAGGDRLAAATTAVLEQTEQAPVRVLASAVPDHAVLRGARSVVAAEVRALLLQSVTRSVPDAGTAPATSGHHRVGTTATRSTVSG
ncbi:ROK family transcriptional regulator [Oerskovia flava]|uniref:ROK family transcriptional regulator n=1 Tax=Oerskovia flava TaxID=2986422 RepID=UPI00223EDBEE|nr:ROK family transcriptional regulator [Oerskovia sp. JB1-3-2]